ncbi:MAG: hypothetical protein A3K19_19985 [Lentisphaerae bacterium RIFOXYB12_FULL_65_16]|nr:MAG: hypothetical protein A3K18_01830 [Lentisphaerae bacterium RIFOXYA12_64_32]OGV87033.1 MAG: hypothetical protein A3K19_19985 [Lentisphaerae bacterium RIFOXYB12_FULL_65_16]
MSERFKVRPRKVFLGMRVGWVVVLAVVTGIAVTYACGALGYTPRIGWLAAVSLAVPLAILAGLRYYSVRYWVDDHCVTRYSGILWRTRRVIPLRQITSLTVRQGPLGRVLHCGDVSIFTASSGGEGAVEEKLAGIPNPHKLRRDILHRLYRIDRSGSNIEPPPDDDDVKTDSAPPTERESVESLLRGIRDSLERIEKKLEPPPPRT